LAGQGAVDAGEFVGELLDVGDNGVMDVTVEVVEVS
jgi:sugar phosphate isomerase/epimerase